MSFCYEDATGVVGRQAVGSVGASISRTQAAEGCMRRAVGEQPRVFAGDVVRCAHGGAVARRGRGRPRARLRRVIADRGYDSDPLRERLKKRGTDLIVPYRSNNKQRRYEDGRKLRRYKRRWKIERTNAWLQNFRRIQVR